MKRIAIVGGGLAGVASAYFQRKQWGKKAQIFLIEKEARVGGWIQSLFHKGFFFEQGPRSFRGGLGNRHVLALIEELGLQQEWIGSHPSCLTRYLYVDEKLQALPQNILSFLFSPLSQGFWKALSCAYQTQSIPPDESISTFFHRHLPPTWVKRFVEPLISGIYAGDPSQLSIKSCFPRLHRAVVEKGSLLGGLVAVKQKNTPLPATPWITYAESFPSFSFQGGLHQLIDRLVERAHPQLLCNTTLDCPIWKGKTILLPLSSGNTLTVDALILALPLPAIGALLPPLCPLLSATPLASVVIVHCGYSQKVVKTPGFGYLLPFQENCPVLGATFDSCLFPQHNRGPQERIAIMIGGSKHPEAIDLPDTAFVTLAQQTLSQHMGILTPPEVMHISRLRHAIPQYGLGHEARCKALTALIQGLYPHLSLTGSGIAGVSMPEVLLHAQQLSLN